MNSAISLGRDFRCLFGIAIPLLALCLPGWAQVDPTPRQLVQIGYNQPIQGKAPFAAYAFYYHNEPGFVRPDWTLRAAVAPVYVDLELAFRGLIAPQTDFAVGLAGGGFADNYAEIRSGAWRQEESFSGHAGEINSSVYHLFNPLPDGATPTRLMEMPLRTSAMRGLGAFANVFAIESFMDEMAALTQQDPLAFRLRHLQDERAKAVLEAEAEGVKV